MLFTAVQLCHAATAMLPCHPILWPWPWPPAWECIGWGNSHGTQLFPARPAGVHRVPSCGEGLVLEGGRDPPAQRLLGAAVRRGHSGRPGRLACMMSPKKSLSDVTFVCICPGEVRVEGGPGYWGMRDPGRMDTRLEIGSCDPRGATCIRSQHGEGRQEQGITDPSRKYLGIDWPLHDGYYIAGISN